MSKAKREAKLLAQQAEEKARLDIRTIARMELLKIDRYFDAIMDYRLQGNLNNTIKLLKEYGYWDEEKEKEKAEFWQKFRSESEQV